MVPRLLLLCALCVGLSTAAVIGIDFGSEYVKVALVKPGTPFHIVLDEQSERKVPAMVTFGESERSFGNGATGHYVRRPKTSFMYAHTVLGRSIDSPQVAKLKEEFYPYEIVQLEGRNGVGFKHRDGDKETVLTPEELVAMTLQHVKRMAEIDAELPVKDCVITVPEFFTQKERQAMLDAAEIAGLNVLSLINENTAACIQYGLDRTYAANETHTALIYNMGSTSTKVTLAEFSGYPDRLKKNKTVGQFEVKAVAYDDSLGGQAFEQNVLVYLVGEIHKQLRAKGDNTDITTNPKAMAKLRGAARKTKHVLSANKEYPVFISSLINDVDFQTFITREKFEEMSEVLFERVAGPVKQVLEEKGLTPAQVDAVLIVGGGTRIPGVQKKLKEYLKRNDLGLNLNGDEAMVMGAVFRAANLSTAFQVRKFGMVDVTPFPVGVRFSDIKAAGAVDVKEEGEKEEAALEDDAEEGAETTGSATEKPTDEAPNKPFSKRAALFRRYNRLAKRKTVAFSHAKDFQVSMHHDNAKVLPAAVSPQIALFNVTGLDHVTADEKHKQLLATQKPKVAVSFLLDGSGMVDIVKAEATLEEMVKVPIIKKVNKTAEANTTATAETTATEGAEAKDDKEGKEGDKTATEEKTEETEKAAEGETGASTTIEQEPEEFEMKKKVHKFPLRVTRGPAPGAVAPMTNADMRESKAKLAKYNRQDETAREIAQAKNNVEAHIYGTRNLLNNDEAWEAVSTDEQRETLRAALETAEEWLYEQSDDAARPFVDKLSELKKLSEPIAFRVREAVERPQILNTTLTMLNYTKGLLATWAEEKPWLPKDEVEDLTKLITDLEAFVTKKEAEQAEKAAHEVPAYASEELQSKLQPIAKLGASLMKRKKPAEPKPKPAPKDKKDNDTAAETAGAGEGKEKDAGDSKAEDEDATAGAKSGSKKSEEREKPKDDL